MKYDNHTLKRYLALKNYPFPIANSANIIRRAIEEGRDAFELYSHLIDAHEHCLRFLSILFLADLKTDKNNKYAQKIMEQIVSTPKHSLGHWQSILNNLMQYAGDSNHDPCLQEILNNKKEILKITRAFIPARNVVTHHFTLPLPKVSRLFNNGLKNYFRLIELLQPLEQIKLYILKRRLNETIEVYDCDGFRMPFDEDDLPDGPQYDGLIALEAFIATPYTPVLPLGLLTIYLVGVHNHEYNLYLFENAQANTHVELNSINDHSTLHLTATEVTVKIKDLSEDDLDDEEIPEKDRVKNALTLTSYNPPNAGIYVQILIKYQQDYTFARKGFRNEDSQEQVLLQNAAVFVGREEIVSDILDFIQNTPQGYLIIEGEPGQGKTSLMAYLAHQGGYIHHFISKDYGRNSIEGIYLSLCQQLKSNYQLDYDWSEIDTSTEYQLNRIFASLLTEAAGLSDKKKLVLCIDAMDEMEDRNVLDFFPARLPADVIVIASSRPVDLRPREDYQLYPLPPLTYEDFLKILKNRGIILSETDQQIVYQRCGGNALFIKHTLDALQEGTITVGELPATIEAFYEKILDDVKKDKRLLKIIKRIIGLLCVSKAGFDKDELCHIIGIKKEDLYSALSRVRQYLVCGDDGFRLYHKLMPDYFLGSKSWSFMPAEIKGFHKMLIKYCEPIQVTHNKYGQQNLPYHYFEAGDVEGLALLFDRADENTYPAIYSWLGLFSSYAGDNDPRVKHYQTLKDMIMHGSSIKAQRIFATHLYYIADYKLAASFLETVLSSAENLHEEDRQRLTLLLAWSYYEMADIGKILRLLGAIPKESIIESLRDAYDDIESNICFNIGDLTRAVQIHEGIEARCRAEGRQFPYYSGLGQAYWLMGRNDDALRCHFSALRMNQANFDKVAQAKDHGNIGLVKYFIGEVSEAMKEQEQARELFEQYNFSSGLSMVYRNMGCVELLARNIDAAEDYFNKGQVIDEQNSQNYGLVDYYNNIGVIHMKRGNYQQAVENFKAAYQLDEEITVVIDGVKLRTNTGGANSANCNLALTSLILYGDLANAESVLSQELEEFTAMSSLEEQIYCCVNRALIAYFQNSPEASASLLKDAHERARHSRSRWLNGLALTRLCQLCQATGDKKGLSEARQELRGYQFSPHPKNPVFTDCAWALDNIDRLVVPFQRCIEYY